MTWIILPAHGRTAALSCFNFVSPVKERQRQPTSEPTTCILVNSRRQCLLIDSLGGCVVDSYTSQGNDVTIRGYWEYSGDVPLRTYSGRERILHGDRYFISGPSYSIQRHERYIADSTADLYRSSPVSQEEKYRLFDSPASNMLPPFVHGRQVNLSSWRGPLRQVVSGAFLNAVLRESNHRTITRLLRIRGMPNRFGMAPATNRPS
jgi:hypothetical protein